uniref:CN hydrolase domain-containing protein n=1 Tax=Aureoumbra lagunensis TaxID=44058 RepID=A0A7S3NPL0_9STRA|mmetsp:Transcript_1549/g.2317  ORF Transcript_1549/g.2317 Transcript_1549/m.2317 type:complete len:320 (+) Transcript_1549:23-982(+)
MWFVKGSGLSLGKRLASAGLLTVATQLTVRSSSSSASLGDNNNLRVAIIQMRVEEEKNLNLAHCAELVEKAANTGADLLVLPEVWNSEYAVGAFRKNAEKMNFGPSTKLLKMLAKKHKVWIVGGSIPELGDDDCVYNTSPIVNDQGVIVATHRKVHLFDIDVPNKIRFFESETLSAGNQATVVPNFRDHALGVAICYDMRFAELAISMRNKGATILCYPGAFNTVTGPLAYQLLARARALDGQSFVIAASPARNPNSSYQAYGHSIIVDPWGTPVAKAQGHEEEIVVADLSLDAVSDVRAAMRLWDQRRPDVYDLDTSS